MTTFTIDTDNHITAHATPEEAAAATSTPFDTFSSQPEFAELAKSWPAQRLVAIWNSLPGAPPIKKFQDRTAATSRIWERIQALAVPVQPPPAQLATPKAKRQTKRGARVAKGAPAKGKSARKASAVKNAPRAKQAAQVPEVSVAGRGSKKAEVISGISSTRCTATAYAKDSGKTNMSALRIVSSHSGSCRPVKFRTRRSTRLGPKLTTVPQNITRILRRVSGSCVVKKFVANETKPSIK